MTARTLSYRISLFLIPPISRMAPVLLSYALLALIALSASLWAANPALAETPLLQEGKKTLFQRVVSHPEAQLYPDFSSQQALRSVTTFTVFYVYNRQGERVQVGVNSNKPDGWINATSLTYWPQAITMMFTERLGRMPVLFFKEHTALVDTCTSEKLGEQVLALNKSVQEAMKSGTHPADLPVVAAEPDDAQGAVSRKRFYLMPVLAVDDQFGDQTRLLQVASIDPGNTGSTGNTGSAGSTGSTGSTGSAGSTGSSASAEQRTALAFVVDTTISMKPYIEQTKALIRSIFDELEKSPHGDKVAFAVVAYRSSLTKSPKLEYLSKVISDFRTVRNRAELETALSNLDEATTSSHAFNEDAMAGVKTAVENLSWNNYAARVMLLVSDAGFLPGADPASSTRMDAREMADYLKTHSIYLTTTHIKTPAGKANIAEAERQYMELSKLDDNSSSYIAIDAGTPAKGAKDFGKVGKVLADGYRSMAEATAAGQLLAKPEDVAPKADPEERAKQIAQRSGYAMQLDFLGTKNNNRAPGVVSAWMADADLEKLSRNQQGAPVRAAYPAVLLTKNQLNDLSARLRIIIDEAERTKRTDSKDFFQGILSASAQLTRDPAGFSRTPGQNLAQTGVLGEYLNGLPYKSDILLMNEEDWYNKSTGEQTAFINRLKSRLARYEEYDKDRANWESFGAENPGDWVYRVPLDILP